MQQKMHLLQTTKFGCSKRCFFYIQTTKGVISYKYNDIKSINYKNFYSFYKRFVAKIVIATFFVFIASFDLCCINKYIYLCTRKTSKYKLIKHNTVKKKEKANETVARELNTIINIFKQTKRKT